MSADITMYSVLGTSLTRATRNTGGVLCAPFSPTWDCSTRRGSAVSGSV